MIQISADLATDVDTVVYALFPFWREGQRNQNCTKMAVWFDDLNGCEICVIMVNGLWQPGQTRRSYGSLTISHYDEKSSMTATIDAHYGTEYDPKRLKTPPVVLPSHTIERVARLLRLGIRGWTAPIALPPETERIATPYKTPLADQLLQLHLEMTRQLTVASELRDRAMTALEGCYSDVPEIQVEQVRRKALCTAKPEQFHHEMMDWLNMGAPGWPEHVAMMQAAQSQPLIQPEPHQLYDQWMDAHARCQTLNSLLEKYAALQVLKDDESPPDWIQ